MIKMIIVNKNNVHIMKGLRGVRSTSSLNNASSIKPPKDKENQPLNAKGKGKEAQNRPLNKKIGIKIRSRIQQPELYQRQALTQLKESQLINQPCPRMRESQSCESVTLKRVKSVSFDEKERGISEGLAHEGSKKSILKNSLVRSKCGPSLQKSQISLANSHVNLQDQSIENNTNNKTIVNKHEVLLQTLRRENKKYKDDIYPPLQSSIYLNNSLMKNFCEMFAKEGRTVEWMRLSELYKDWKLVLWTNDEKDKCVISKGCITKTSGDGDFISAVFNSFSGKNAFLEKIFQTQKVNQQCLYRIKMHQTQTNIWKYLLVDDYIPVVINNKLGKAQRYQHQNVRPAFLDVVPKGDKIELWPFLLQKAYAKYYSTYDSLANGNTIDFLEEVTGTFVEKIEVSCDNIEKIRKIMRNQDAMMIGKDYNGVYHPIVSQPSEQNHNTFGYLDRQAQYSLKQLPLDSFPFVEVYFTHLHKYYYTSRCQIQQENIKPHKKPKQAYILREFTLEDHCECQIGTIQKEQRFFRNYLTYQYAWVRIIVAQKESSGYRWVDSAYSNCKTTKIYANLLPGDYVVIIMPEWKEKPYNFNLVFKGTSQTFFQRKPYELYPNIFEESCMDLAQRQGQLVQVNRNICSYHYIEKKIGIIIENINNEKEKGWVRILRSVDGLQNYGIKAFNEDFKNKKSAEIVIANRSHYTVILMTTKGVKKGLLDMFDFGSEHKNIQ